MPEDEYFRKLDAEAREKLKSEMDTKKVSAEREAKKALHHLKCGKCGADMQVSMFRGIEIDVCGECNAVLLDPGELKTLAGDDSTGVLGSFFSMFGSGKSGSGKSG